MGLKHRDNIHIIMNLFVILSSLLVSSSIAFQSNNAINPKRIAFFHVKKESISFSQMKSTKSNNEFNDFPDFPNNEEEITTPIGGENIKNDSDVDWDAEWKKVVKNKDQPSERPKGINDYAKSDIEIAALRTKNQVESKLRDIEVPSFRFDSLKGDWKFWIGILALISVGSSLIAASGQSQIVTNGSYYI